MALTHPIQINKSFTLGSLKAEVDKLIAEHVKVIGDNPIRNGTVIVNLGIGVDGSYTVNTIRVLGMNRVDDRDPMKDEMNFGQVMTQRVGVKTYKSFNSIRSDMSEIFGPKVSYQLHYGPESEELVKQRQSIEDGTRKE